MEPEIVIVLLLMWYLSHDSCNSLANTGFKRPTGTFDISRTSGYFANKASNLNSVATVKKILCKLLELVVVPIIVSSLTFIIIVQRPIIYFGEKVVSMCSCS